MSLLYVYAILAAPARTPAELHGIAGEALRFVPASGLVVAVGTVDAAPPIAPQELRRHDAAVRGLAAGAKSLLPMRFGQTVTDRDALRACVERSLPRLRQILTEVEGAEQMTLRLPRTGAAGAPAELRGADDSIAGPGTRYLLERQHQQVLARTAPPELVPLLERVAPRVRAQRVQRSEGGRLAASVYQLIASRDLADYLARLGAGLRSLPHLRVRVSGPWPPYAFSDGIDLASGGAR